MPFRQVIINGKTIVISVAEMVVTRSGTAFSRPVHALDQVLLEQTLARAENAIRKPNAFPPELEGKVRRIKLSSLDHPSPLDPRSHSTAILLDESGEELGKIHVTTDPALQGPARSSRGAGGK